MGEGLQARLCIVGGNFKGERSSLLVPYQSTSLEKPYAALREEQWI